MVFQRYAHREACAIKAAQQMKQTLMLSLAITTTILIVSGCFSPPEQPVKSNLQYLKSTNELTYMKIGKEVTDSVGAALKANLLKSMGTDGPIEAVEFCNAQALPLTDSFNQKYNTEVKRTSDRLRNSQNAPTAMEKQVMEDYRAEQALGKMLTPKLAIDAMGRKMFYAPIFTGTPCLICHGNEGNMDNELRTKIKEYYPDDNAKGFDIDELRGIWSVTFKNS